VRPEKGDLITYSPSCTQSTAINTFVCLPTDALSGITIDYGHFVLGDAPHNVFDLTPADPITYPSAGTIIGESSAQ